MAPLLGKGPAVCKVAVRLWRPSRPVKFGEVSWSFSAVKAARGCLGKSAHLAGCSCLAIGDCSKAAVHMKELLVVKSGEGGSQLLVKAFLYTL